MILYIRYFKESASDSCVLVGVVGAGLFLSFLHEEITTEPATAINRYRNKRFFVSFFI
jgi:hypothetical protein